MTTSMKLTATMFTTGALAILACQTATATPYTSAVLADNPTAYWRLGEGVGPNVFDEVTLTNNATYGGGEALGVTPGAVVGEPAATAIGYDGTASTFSTGSTLGQSLFGAQAELTIEFWIRPNVSQSAIHHFEYPNTSNFSLEGNSLTPNWFVNNTNVGSVTLTEDVFQHVAFVYDGTGGEARIYRNGTQVSFDNTGVPASVIDTLSSFYLGSRNGSTRIPTADFQELAIYQDVLTQLQIQAHYDASFQEVVGIPEPSSLLLLGLGVLGMMRHARRRRARA